MVDKVPKPKKRKDPKPVVEARRENRRRRSDEWNTEISSTISSIIDNEDR